ncbi:vitamin D3 hydroxylase-associated protein-like [Neopelma chrysocephalum]|uniref:vitamin D3 hydroxylase-associated protein-like n=1 Tax=Neopelma chrysocephalum TaxID=114329 RepID=UPI000FCCEF38|nr:vitamin D3 hydroxylase-associated protein-like [Neopelma chrysocephalum]
MTQEQVLDPSWGDPRALSALLCSSASAVMLLKWLGHRQVQQKMHEARRSWDLALERMEKATRRFKQENPGTQTTHILSLTMMELVEKLKEGSLSPESILYSYMDKALEVNQEVNCVTDFIHDCEDQLQKLKKQKEKGLLYGIPISIKDHINCKGHISSGGMVKFLGQVKEEDSVINRVLKHQGAIPFVKTDIPQTMINYDCSNLIFGQTLNPLNHQKSPRGSSGGEAALIAGGGSILGVGSDVAGSIRLPSSFCGLCGLKHTGNRIRYIPASVLFFHPVGKLQGVPKSASNFAIVSMVSSRLKLAPNLPSCQLGLKALLMTQDDFYLLAQQRLIQFLIALAKKLSAKNLWDQHGAVAVYHTEFIAKWRKLRLDVILCPALGPAFNHSYAGKLFAATSYTNLYNVLNFPAGVVLVSTVTRADKEELKHYQGHYRDPWDKRLKEAVEGAVGLPVAVQCVALPWQEELCLRFMKEVETLAHNTKRNV